MTGLQPEVAVMTLVALLLSVGNLLVTLGQTRVKQEQIDLQALEMAVQLAQKTPLLEQQLREALADLHQAQEESRHNRDEIAALHTVIGQQRDTLRTLQQDNVRLAAELAGLKMTLQTLQKPHHQEG